MIYNLFRFLVKDYLTIFMTLFLIVTVWRTINTLEILYDYAQRYRKGGGFIIDFKLKDLSLQKRLYIEFRNLLRDIIFLVIFILTIAMIHRANQTIGRLKRI